MQVHFIPFIDKYIKIPAFNVINSPKSRLSPYLLPNWPKTPLVVAQQFLHNYLWIISSPLPSQTLLHTSCPHCQPPRQAPAGRIRIQQQDWVTAALLVTNSNYHKYQLAFTSRLNIWCQPSSHIMLQLTGMTIIYIQESKGNISYLPTFVNWKEEQLAGEEPIEVLEDQGAKSRKILTS